MAPASRWASVVGVGVGVSLGVGVNVGTAVIVGVAVAMGTAVAVGVGAGVAVAMAVGVTVGVESNRPQAAPTVASRASSPRMPHPRNAALFPVSGVAICSPHTRIGDTTHSSKVPLLLPPSYLPSYCAVRSIFSTARKASCGTSTFPMRFSLFFPSACFSSSFRFLVTSPP